MFINNLNSNIKRYLFAEEIRYKFINPFKDLCRPKLPDKSIKLFHCLNLLSQAFIKTFVKHLVKILGKADVRV